jgi:hypothetical protein
VRRRQKIGSEVNVLKRKKRREIEREMPIRRMNKRDGKK